MSTTPAGSAETNLPQTGPSAFDDHRPPAARAARRLRALRLLPADLPDLPAVGRGDGLPARADLPDEPRGEGRDRARRPVPRAHRPVPGLHGLRDRLPVGRAVRQAARVGAPAARAQRPPRPGGPGCSARRSSRCSRTSGGCGRRPCPGRCTRSCDGCRRSRRSRRSCRAGSARSSRCCRRCRCARRSRGSPSTPPRRGSGAPRSRCSPGCVQDVFFHRVNEATVRVLAAEGCDVLVPRDQQCCGALELHAGREDRRAGARPAHDRPVRAARGRPRGRQRRRLRIVDEGVRPPARRRPGVGGAREARSARRSATCTRCSPTYRRRRPARPAAPGRAPESPTTTPATSATPRACAPSRGPCCARSRSWRSSTSPRPRCAAARPASTTWWCRKPAAELGARKAAQHPVGAAGHRGHREPGLPAADRQAPRRTGARWGHARRAGPGGQRSRPRRPAAAAPRPAARRLDPRGPGPAYLTAPRRGRPESVGGRR